MNGLLRVTKGHRIFNLIKSRASSYVKIGNVSKPIVAAYNPQLVPVKYLPSDMSQKLLQNLKWMLQKDLIGQDIFLIGPPGKSRRELAMMYLEMTNQEMEYIVLSRDTTESDIKQRREIQNGSAVYMNQSAVRAAIHGRVLVLEGIEKAERNVLPILNNLLENREMQLEDGRFLMAAERFDDLKEKYGEKLLHQLQLVRCSDQFRVIALGLPTPKFRGNPLDPPLRSRFQARHVISVDTFENTMQSALDQFQLPPERMYQLASFAHAVNTNEAESLQLPHFPVDNLLYAFQLLEHCPQLSNDEIMERLYPTHTLLNADQQDLVKDFKTKFEIQATGGAASMLSVQSILKKDTDTAYVQLSVRGNREPAQFPVPTGDHFIDYKASLPAASLETFVSTPRLESLLASMIHSHSVADFCLVAPKGAGKLTLCREFARRLGYAVDHILLYADMSARDLLQQRTTDPNTGDTSWRNSAFVEAALHGRLVVLEGLQSVNPSTLAVLYRLIHDRELDLFDGTRLLRQDRYDHLMHTHQWSHEQMREKGVLRIDPRFRIVALAQPPMRRTSAESTLKNASPASSTATSSATAAATLLSSHWFTPELLSVFLFHSYGAMPRAEEEHIVRHRVPHCNARQLSQLLDVVHHLRSSHDNTEFSLSENLSTRQVIRIAQQLSKYPHDSIADTIRQACLYSFLPRTAASSLDQVLELYGFAGKPFATDHEELTCVVDNDLLTIGQVSVPVTDVHLSTSEMHSADAVSKIPHTLFYDSQEHLSVMQSLLKQWNVPGDRQHFLLIGNQGVGKNKIVDRLLHLLKRPREYIQLHRDTTVQSLISNTSIKDRQLVYEESPLLKAVRKGHILVIDEVDKAPTQVTSVLRSLILNNEMQLPDGRRIVPLLASSSSTTPHPSHHLPLHPDFRMIVLANRPGFPFLGNDFFSVMGDAFSCHVVNNPDPVSEVRMLQRYGPNVSVGLLHKLVALFSDLRHMADEGTIQYPYSTRELVNVVKHLQHYPNDGLSTVLRNVFDFDAYTADMRNIVNETLLKHGIPLLGEGEADTAVHVAPQFPLGEAHILGKWTISSALETAIAEKQEISFKGPIYQLVSDLDVEHSYHRSSHFTELEQHIRLPLEEDNLIGASAVSRCGDGQDVLHTVTVNPITVMSVNLSNPKDARVISLADLFPNISGSFIPELYLAALPAPMQDSVLLLEAFSNTLLLLNTVTGELSRLMSPALPEVRIRRVNTWGRPVAKPEVSSRMITASIPDNVICFHTPNSSVLELWNCDDRSWNSVRLKQPIQSVRRLARDYWLLDSDRLLHRNAKQQYTLHSITNQADDITSAEWGFMTQQNIHQDPKLLGSHKNKFMSDRWAFHQNKVLGFMNFPNVKSETPIVSYALSNEIAKSSSSFKPSYESLPNASMLVRTLSVKDCPPAAVQNVVGTTLEMLQVVNLKECTEQYLAIPRSEQRKLILSWLKPNIIPIHLHATQPASFTSAENPNTSQQQQSTVAEDLITVDSRTGHCLIWQVAPSRLENSLAEWKRMVGEEADGTEGPDFDATTGKRRQRDLMLERNIDGADMSLKTPKFGKVDLKNAPHVGGNTWAGGTGGRDTAGLGGVGGPFRLDAGHDIHQVPEFVKASVPPHITEAAREMAQKAWRKRLREIEMSEYDASLYDSYANKVRSQITSLRNVLENLQARSKERDWLRHQSDGDLDEGKLVEGLLGERAVYKRRADKPPDPHQPLQKPKILRIVADVSGSMYRFNGHDQRLERQLESILMIMEACATLPGLESRLCLEIFGHSGEGPQYPFLRSRDKQSFSNEKQRLNILKAMLAHSQFCVSGDHTIEAVRNGQEALGDIDWADERFLVIFSDANLNRYGIHPKHLSRLLTNDNVRDESRRVNTYAVFIGSLGDQAENLARHLPAGHAFVCLDNKKLPQIMKQIFQDTILQNNS